MAAELDAVTRLHVEKAVDTLVEEFGESVPRADIERLMDDSLARVVREASVNDFVATLAYRFARERLMASGHASGAAASDAPAILFVGLHGSGRGQMAAALAALRSEGRVRVNSAGNDPSASVDPVVVEAMAEVGADLSEAYTKPISAEVMDGADVVVTLGHSVGKVEVPASARHEDWRVGDPTGASLDEVRRIREDIDRRVDALLDELLS
jgi:arsenate reductase (thioredoxin)